MRKRTAQPGDEGPRRSRPDGGGATSLKRSRGSSLLWPTTRSGTYDTSSFSSRFPPICILISGLCTCLLLISAIGNYLGTSKVPDLDMGDSSGASGRLRGTQGSNDEQSNLGSGNADGRTQSSSAEVHIPPTPTIYAIGLVRYMSEIHPAILKWLAEVNCNHGVGLHIVTAHYDDQRNKLDGLDHYRSRIVDENSREPTEEPNSHVTEGKLTSAAKNQRKLFPGCAPVIIVEENTNEIYGKDGEAPSNRVERIAALRDYQRELLRPYYYTDDGKKGSNGNDGAGGTVIIIDLDLAALPPPKTVLAVATLLATSPQYLDGKVEDEGTSYPYDAICAAGVTAAARNELWYYDTYATVLLPDTYVHPLQRRLIKSYYPGEDPGLVRSDNRNGNWTQGDIMRYFQGLGKQSDYGAVEVKSCFGGMAMYRSRTWFDKTCRYGMDPAGLERYASEADGRPCEHVVFHDCLARRNNDGSSDDSTRVAIMPTLVTLWKKDKKRR